MVARVARSASAKQGLQFSSPVERNQVVATADMGVADEDLRHRASASQVHHRRALRRIEIDPDLVERFNAALPQQRFGMDTKGTHRGGEYLDW